MATTIEPIGINPKQICLLLAEAANLRREGAHGAAVVVEADAIRAVRSARAEIRPGVA